MAFNHYAIQSTKSSENADSSQAIYTAVTDLVQDVFEQIRVILERTGKFQRVNANTLTVTIESIYYFRESYKFVGNESKYLTIQIKTLASYTSTLFELSVVTSNEITESSTSQKTGDFTVELLMLGSESGSKRTRSVSFYLNAIEKKDMCIFNFSAGSSNKMNYNVISCMINGDTYISICGGSTTSYQTFFDSNNTKYYSGTNIISEHNGVFGSGMLLTLPVYLSGGVQTASMLYENLKINGMIQVPSKSCSYGSIYNVNGKEYLALHDNILVEIN